MRRHGFNPESVKKESANNMQTLYNECTNYIVFSTVLLEWYGFLLLLRFGFQWHQRSSVCVASISRKFPGSKPEVNRKLDSRLCPNVAYFL